MSLSNEPQKDNSVENNSFFTKGPRLKVPEPVVKKPKKINPLLIGLASALAISLGGNTAQFVTHNKTPDNAIAKLGKIVEKQEQNGAIAYLVETTQGGKAVVFGAKGVDALFYGDAYQADTQDVMFSNIKSKSTEGLQAQATTNAPTTNIASSSTAATSVAGGESPYAEYGQNDMTPGQAIGEIKGKVPDLFPILDALPGFKYDPSVAPGNTVYVVYDPRCPYCHQLFEATRKMDLKAKGITIKWLPTTVLGESEDALAQAVQATKVKTIDEFAATLGKNGEKAKTVTDADRKGIRDITALFAKAHETAFAGSAHGASVPATFFLDKRTGEPRFIYGASLPEIQKTIFGE